MGTNLGQMPAAAAAAKNSSRNSGYGENIQTIWGDDFRV